MPIKSVVRKDDAVGPAKLVGCLVAPFVALAVLAVLGLTFVYVSSQTIPAHSAEVFSPELNLGVKLKFYYTWGDRDSGRYISVTTPYGVAKGNIDGWDWLFNARTNIYVTHEGNVAIIGPHQADYIVDSKTLKLKTLTSDSSSDSWKYLGAFDLKGSLKFFPASDERECIKMLMEYIPDPSFPLPRDQYRHESCDSATTRP
jgi:hypothetical protein